MNHLLNLNVDVINNRNIKNRHFSRKGPCLNDSGSKLLARNFLEKIKLFWVDKRCSSIILKVMNLGIFQKMIITIIHLVKLIIRKNTWKKNKGFREILNGVREKKINRPIIEQLNINLIRNKFHFFEFEASKHLDILLISETKIDETFLLAQFLLDGFSRPYRLDNCANGGGKPLYVRDDISACLLI